MPVRCHEHFKNLSGSSWSCSTGEQHLRFLDIWYYSSLQLMPLNFWSIKPWVTAKVNESEFNAHALPQANEIYKVNCCHIGVIDYPHGTILHGRHVVVLFSRQMCLIIAFLSSIFSATTWQFASFLPLSTNLCVFFPYLAQLCWESCSTPNNLVHLTIS